MTLLEPLYDIRKTCDENYDQGPFFRGKFPERIKLKTPYSAFGYSVNSPFGIPAGPLFNSRYIEVYARLGFDILVYKTVRSQAHAVHPFPNCIYVPSDPLNRESAGGILHPISEPSDLEHLSITNSFGVQSKDPSVWMPDVERANQSVEKDQLVIVSAMGTQGAGGRDFIEDYAYTAALAKEAGAKVIELNFSCPNLCTGEGAIYSSPETSSEISQKVKKAIGNTPLVIKVGALDSELLEKVFLANAPFVQGVSGINTIAMNVDNLDGTPALPGEGRRKSGVCGRAIREVSQAFIKDAQALRKKHKFDFTLIGVGGIMKASDALERLHAGADLVMSGTAAMWDPYLAREVLRALERE